MTTKDEAYDPAVNYDSGSDTEQNNVLTKWGSPSSPSSSLDGIFIHNDLHGLKRGGPQVERVCPKCNNKKEMYYVRAYECSDRDRGRAEDHQFCEQCAEDKSGGEHVHCPICPGRVLRLPRSREPRPPIKV